MARLEVTRGEMCDHGSGLGESPLRAVRDDGFDDAALKGRGIGLNSFALAFRSRGLERGVLGRLAVNWAWAWVACVCARMGLELGKTGLDCVDSLPALADM
jgi:hypothetical protein